MKLLVTGGAGYIGSIVAAQLLDAGHDVTVLDSLVRGHAAAVPEGVPLEQVDLLDAEAVNATLAGGYDAVLHFAALALVAESVEHPERYHRGNFVATLNLLDAMRAAGCKRLVFSSTCAVYGEPAEVPMPETLRDRPGQRLRRLQARGRPHDQRRVPRARARRGLAALLQRRGRERRPRRGPRARDPHHPARAAGRGRQARARLGVRHRLRHARRHRRARLHPHRGPRRGPHPRPRARHRARASTASTTSATAPASRSAR